MMKFHQIRFTNFMPYKGNGHEINFPTDSHRNILLIHGSNTYGKTSILRGIRWGLYGKVSDKRNHQYNYLDLLNWTSADESNYEFEVLIKFEDNGNTYVLTRNVSKKTNIDIPKSDNDFTTKVFLEKNGSTLSGADIEHEISLIAPEPVSRFFLFDGELLQEYQELLEDGSEVGIKIKESIEQILGVPALINGRNDTAALLKDAQRKQKNELNKSNEINELATSRDDLSNKIEQSEKEISRLNIQLDEIHSKKSHIESSIKDIEQKSRVAKDLDRVRSRIKFLKSEIEDLEFKKLESASKAWKVLLKQKLYEVQKKSLASLSDIIDQFEDVGALKKEAQLLTDLLEKKNCEVCNTAGANFNEILIKEKINSIQKKISSTLVNKKLFSKITNQSEIVNTLLEDSEDRSFKDIDTELGNKYVEITTEESNEDDLVNKSGITDTEEIKASYESVGKYSQLSLEIEKQIREQNSLIDTYRSQMSSINKLIDNNPESSESPTTKYVSIYNSINDLFKDSITNLRDKLKGEVESKATEAFIELIHRDYKGLKINDNYGLTIIDKNDKPVYIKSSGAEQIVALSLIDALARTGRSSGPVVMDTPFGRLDPTHRVNILKYLPKTSSQLVLFVHAGETDERILALIADQIGGEYEIKLQADNKNSLIQKIH